MLNHNRLWSRSAVWGTALLLGAAATQLSAAGFNDDRTVVTFSNPVEIGNQALGAGTYVFKTLGDDRNIVEVMNGDGTHLVALVNTIPITAPQMPEKTLIEMNEGPANAPESVHAWFYPGETTGWEFPAPKT